jgi:ribosomal protein L3 glutamine methyltransferase
VSRFQLRSFSEQSESAGNSGVPTVVVESLPRLRQLTKEASTSLSTVRDLIRFCTTRLTKSSAFFGHGTDDPYEEAIFLISHATRLTPTVLEPLADSKLTPRQAIHPVLHFHVYRSNLFSSSLCMSCHSCSEVNEILELLTARIQQRIPAAYLANTVCRSRFQDYFFDYQHLTFS